MSVGEREHVICEHKIIYTEHVMIPVRAVGWKRTHNTSNLLNATHNSRERERCRIVYYSLLCSGMIHHPIQIVVVAVVMRLMKSVNLMEQRWGGGDATRTAGRPFITESSKMISQQ